MKTWIKFFAGTPQRFLATAGAVALVVVIVCPGLLATASNRLMLELAPVLGPALNIAIILGAFVFVWKAVTKK